jgi:hypothetical protein
MVATGTEHCAETANPRASTRQRRPGKAIEMLKRGIRTPG